MCYGKKEYSCKFWDFQNQKYKNGVLMQEKLSKITGIHIFSDEDKVIISSEKHILLWKIQDDLEKLRVYSTQLLISTDLSKDNNNLICGFDDGSISILSVQDFKPIRSLDSHQIKIQLVKYSPQQTFILSKSIDYKIRNIDPITFKVRVEKKVPHFMKYHQSTGIFDDDKYILLCAIGYGILQLDSQTLNIYKNIDISVNIRNVENIQVTCFLISTSNTQIILGDSQGQICIFSLIDQKIQDSDGKLRTIINPFSWIGPKNFHTDQISCLSITKNKIFTGSQDNSCKSWGFKKQ